MLTYSVELKPQAEGGYTVTVPALPGCISEGDSLEDALTNIQDAAEAYIKTMAEHNRKIPVEFSDIRQIEIFKQKQSVPAMVSA